MNEHSGEHRHRLAGVDKWALFGLAWAIGCTVYGVWKWVA